MTPYHRTGSRAAKLGGARSLIAVPMLKENELVGAIAIYRQEVRPFTDKQIELVKNFAAQAVIAIENARLLNDLRQRTDDLSEALEQQTATSEVLQVISSSPGELEPVFQAMLANATRICEAKFGLLHRYDNGWFHAAALARCAARACRFRSAARSVCSARWWRPRPPLADKEGGPHPRPSSRKSPIGFGHIRGRAISSQCADA